MKKTRARARTRSDSNPRLDFRMDEVHLLLSQRMPLYLSSSCPTVLPCLDYCPEGGLGVGFVLLLLLLPLLCSAVALLLLCCCFCYVQLLCCSAAAAHGVGWSEIYCAVPPRAPPSFPAPTVVPGAALGVHDVLLLLLLLRLFCRCCDVCAAAVLFCCCYVCDMFSLLTPVSTIIMQVNPSR